MRHLQNCKVCGCPSLRLFQKSKVVFCTEMTIVCDKCDRDERKLYQEMQYNLRVLKTMPKKSLKERKLRKKKKNETDHKQRKLNARQEMHHTIDSAVNTKFSKEI